MERINLLHNFVAIH